MITKTIINGMVSILEDGSIQWREDTVIDEDGVELSRTYHRTILLPSSDTSGITDPVVKSIANLVWTPEIIAAYQTKIINVPPLPLVS